MFAFLLPASYFSELAEVMIAKKLRAKGHLAPVEVEIEPVRNPGNELVPAVVSPKYPPHTFFFFGTPRFLKKNQLWSMQRGKKRRWTCQDRPNKAGNTGVVKARHQGTCVASTDSLEKPYKNRLMQKQVMENTAGWVMRHWAILDDFASPGAIETSIIECRIARFCVSVTPLVAH